MITALVLTALVESATIGPRPVLCTFPAATPGETTIEVEMTARPSLKDLPGLYRVTMAIDGTPLRAAAQPIITTDARDVLVRASRNSTVFYALGFDEAGAAALNVIWQAEGEIPERRLNRVGRCRDYERYLPAWSAQ